MSSFPQSSKQQQGGRDALQGTQPSGASVAMLQWQRCHVVSRSKVGGNALRGSGSRPAGGISGEGRHARSAFMPPPPSRSFLPLLAPSYPCPPLPPPPCLPACPPHTLSTRLPAHSISPPAPRTLFLSSRLQAASLPRPFPYCHYNQVADDKPVLRAVITPGFLAAPSLPPYQILSDPPIPPCCISLPTPGCRGQAGTARCHYVQL